MMSAILPTVAAVLRPRFQPLLLLLLLTCCCQSVLAQPLQLPLPLPLHRSIVKVRASGFLPFESDLVLPLGILQQLQERASRLLPPPHYAKPIRRRPRPKVKQQLRLERAHVRGQSNGGAGSQLYNLIDDDGELLLNLRVHNDASVNTNSLSLGESRNQLDLDKSGSWQPSRWRPTTIAPPIYSSSPHPLPVHQYLANGNSIEQAPMTQQRRMFGTRPDWRFH